MMSDDDNDGQMIFRDPGGLKLPDICFTGEEKPEKTHPGTCPDRGSNSGPLRDSENFFRRTVYTFSCAVNKSDPSRCKMKRSFPQTRVSRI